MVDPGVKAARMARDIVDENGCPGMHVLVSVGGEPSVRAQRAGRCAAADARRARARRAR
jgi:hypothetical protein